MYCVFEHDPWTGDGGGNDGSGNPDPWEDPWGSPWGEGDYDPWGDGTGGGDGGYGDPGPEPGYDVNASDLSTNQKANCVFSDLGGNTAMQNLLSAYSNNGGTINLTYKVAPTLPGANGQCEAINGNLSNILITLSASYVESARTLEVARTLLHETVHAKIFSELRQIGGYSHLSPDNFPVLWAAYVEAKKKGATMTEAQNRAHHEEMANHYIDLIAQGLQEFDTMNHNNSVITMEHYKAMAWGGLRETNYYNNVLSETERQDIAQNQTFMQSWTSLTCTD